LSLIRYVLGALDLVSQVHQGILPQPKKVFVPLGTGGTAVGLAIGFAIAQMNIETVAVRVVPKAALQWGRLFLGGCEKAGNK